MDMSGNTSFDFIARESRGRRHYQGHGGCPQSSVGEGRDRKTRGCSGHLFFPRPRHAAPQALIHAVGMDNQKVPFGMGDDHNYFHVRGRSFTVAESKLNNNAIWATLFNLKLTERNKSPGDIISEVYTNLVTSNGENVPDDPTPEYWQRFRLDFKFLGFPLNQWGLWPLYRAMGLSEECIAMCASTAGFLGPFFSLGACPSNTNSRL